MSELKSRLRRSKFEILMILWFVVYLCLLFMPTHITEKEETKAVIGSPTQVEDFVPFVYEGMRIPYVDNSIIPDTFSEGDDFEKVVSESVKPPQGKAKIQRRIRETPNGEPIGWVNAGETYDILSKRESPWYLISVGGIEGYAMISYLDSDFPEEVPTYIPADPEDPPKNLEKGSSGKKGSSGEKGSGGGRKNSKYIGRFQITHYCIENYKHICGTGKGVTASGEKATPGVTISTSSTYAFGTKLVINGHTYTVQDRGGAIKGNKVDVCVSTHEEALSKGTYWADVYWG